MTQSSAAAGVPHPKCLKENWITELPKTIIFNLSRVSYDRSTFALVKNSKKFTFEETIYADKFLLSNDLQANVKKINLLKEKEKEITDKIKSFEEYAGVGSLQKILSIAHEFIEGQTEEFEEIKSFEDESPERVRKSPSQIGKLGLRHEQISSALSVLASFRDEVSKKVLLL